MTRAYDFSLWKFIRSGWLNFSNLLRYDVGDGTKVKFWKHVWCGDCSLKETFLELYCLSRARDSLVRLCVGLVGGFIGIFIFVVHRMIGRKNLLTGLWTLFTLWKCRGLALIRFVGSQQGVEVLRLEVFIFLSTFLLFLSLRGWCGNRRFLQGWLSFHDQLL